MRRTTRQKIDTPLLNSSPLRVPARPIVLPKHRPDLRFSLPAGPELPMKFHEFRRGRDGFFQGFEFEDRKPAEDFLRFRERSVKRGHFSSAKLDACAHCGWLKPAALDHLPGFGCFFAVLPDCFHKLFRRRTGIFRRLNQHHESHICLSSEVSAGPVWKRPPSGLYFYDERRLSKSTLILTFSWKVLFPFRGHGPRLRWDQNPPIQKTA